MACVTELGATLLDEDQLPTYADDGENVMLTFIAAID